MRGHQSSWRTLLLLVIAISALVFSNPLPDIKRRNETFYPGPYALRIVSNNPNLTNAFCVGGGFEERPDPKTIQPIWAGAGYMDSFHPNLSVNLYERPGAIFLDERRSQRDSPQLIEYYIKGPDEHVPYLTWSWDTGPVVTHLWPGYWDVSFGNFAFEKRQDSSKVFLVPRMGGWPPERGPDPRWRVVAAHTYNQQLDFWNLKSWNATDPSVPLPQDWEFVDVEVIPFNLVVNRTL